MVWYCIRRIVNKNEEEKKQLLCFSVFLNILWPDAASANNTWTFNWRYLKLVIDFWVIFMVCFNYMAWFVTFSISLYTSWVKIIDPVKILKRYLTWCNLMEIIWLSEIFWLQPGKGFRYDPFYPLRFSKHMFNPVRIRTAT